MTTPQTVLLRGGRVHGPVDGATALLTDGAHVAWVGNDNAAPTADEVVDLAGALVLPAFVDAHVHVTHTGLALDGLDLAAASSLGDALDRLARHARARPDAVLIGTGWDETRWPERRPPVATELDRAAGERLVYLSRIDGHSAVASSSLLAAAPDAAAAESFGADGLVSLVRAPPRPPRCPTPAVDTAGRTAAQRTTLCRAAELGIGALHEMGGPEIAGEDDFAGLLRLAGRSQGPLCTATGVSWARSARRASSALPPPAVTCSWTGRSALTPHYSRSGTPTPTRAATSG